MQARNSIRILALGAVLFGVSLAHAQEPGYGMLFQPKPAAVAPAAQNAQAEPPLVLKSRPATQNDVDSAVMNTQKAAPFTRMPTAMDLARMPLPTAPSATPATFEQQQEERLAAWTAREEMRIEQERQIRLAQEKEANKQVIIVQQQDPFLSNLLAIPRAIGYLFGGMTALR